MAGCASTPPFGRGASSTAGGSGRACAAWFARSAAMRHVGVRPPDPPNLGGTQLAFGGFPPGLGGQGGELPRAAALRTAPGAPAPRLPRTPRGAGPHRPHPRRLRPALRHPRGAGGHHGSGRHGRETRAELRGAVPGGGVERPAPSSEGRRRAARSRDPRRAQRGGAGRRGRETRSELRGAAPAGAVGRPAPSSEGRRRPARRGKGQGRRRLPLSHSPTLPLSRSPTLPFSRSPTLPFPRSPIPPRVLSPTGPAPARAQGRG